MSNTRVIGGKPFGVPYGVPYGGAVNEPLEKGTPFDFWSVPEGSNTSDASRELEADVCHEVETLATGQGESHVGG